MEWFRAPPNANRKVELYIIKCNIIPYCNFPYSFYIFSFFHFFNIFMLFLPFAHYIFHAIQYPSRSRFNCWRKCSLCWCWVNEQVTFELFSLEFWGRAESRRLMNILWNVQRSSPGAINKENYWFAGLVLVNIRKKWEMVEKCSYVSNSVHIHLIWELFLRLTAWTDFLKSYLFV